MLRARSSAPSPSLLAALALAGTSAHAAVPAAQGKIKCSCGWLFASKSKCTASSHVRSMAHSHCTEYGAGHLISPFTRAGSHCELSTSGTGLREEQDAFGGLSSIQSTFNQWLPEVTCSSLDPCHCGPGPTGLHFPAQW